MKDKMDNSNANVIINIIILIGILGGILIDGVTTLSYKQKFKTKKISKRYLF